MNPTLGHKTVFQENRVNFIDESNFEEKSKSNEEIKKIEILFLQTTALQGITDIYNELKKI